MKFALVFAAMLAVSAVAQFRGVPVLIRANPPPPPRPVAIRVTSNDQNANVLRYDNVNNPDGGYTYAVEIDNGISAQQQATARDFGVLVAQGAFSWTSPEGQPISISYVADENGYQPSGDAIPVPHPIPEAILRSLEYIRRVQSQNLKKK